MMSCALSDKIKTVLSGNGGTCSTGYAHTVMAAVQAIATCANADVDEQTNLTTAKYLAKLLEANPNLELDLETVAASDPEIASAIDSFKGKYGALILSKSKPNGGPWVVQAKGIFAAAPAPDADALLKQMNEAVANGSFNIGGGNSVPEDSMEEWKDKAINDGLDAALPVFIKQFPALGVNESLNEKAVKAAKSIAKHLSPETGDGQIKDYVGQLVDDLELETQSLLLVGESSDGISKANRDAIVGYYKGVVANLRECMKSAAGDKNGWKKPNMVGNPTLTHTVSDLKQAMSAVPPANSNVGGTEEEKAFYQKTYRGSVRGVMHDFACQIFPPYRVDHDMSIATIKAAKSLSNHVADGVLSATAQNELAKAKAVLEEVEKPDGKYASQFTDEGSRTAFLNHYKSVVADLDACAAELPQKTGKKPQIVRSYLDNLLES